MMSISFHPKAGMVLICDFNSGFVPPEMVKKRRVVIISPYQQNKRGLCTVVPLSTTVPYTVEKFHYCIPAGTYSFFSEKKDVWAKADMLATVSSTRLDRIRFNGHFVAPALQTEDFQALQACIRHYLDI